MDTPVPPAIQGPDEPDETPGPPSQAPSGLQVSEMTTIPGGVSLDKYDAEKKLQGKDLTILEKIDKAKNRNKELGTIKKYAKSPAEVEFQIDQNRAYYQKLKKQIGKALATKRSYKLDTDGFFSDLLLDLEQLFEYNKLYGLDNEGQRVIQEPVDDDFIDLVTKRYNPKQKYSDSAKRMFKKLVTLSQHPLVKSSDKYKNILCYDPTKLVDRLELLIAGIEAGNNNDEIINEGISILDTLLSNKDIKEEQHEGIYRKYFE